jgi:hypothetical protein
LIVDSSGSIGTQMGAVRNGVRDFIRVFDGTPTRLQIIDFDNRSRVLVPAGVAPAWNVYVDMTEPGMADRLIDTLPTIQQGGWTNWEDAFNRAFYSEDGTPLALAGVASAPAPKLVVFFTDGLPTKDRASTPASTFRSGAASTIGTAPWMFNTVGDVFSPRAWWRTDQLLASHRGGLIGIGVGRDFRNSTTVSRWPHNPYQNEKFLGDLIVGADVTDPVTRYVKREYNAGWGDVSTADMLVSSDFSRFSEALQDIALAECGGTLTVQTRTEAGATAPFNLRYTSGIEQVTTSRFARSGTFDINLAGEASRTVQLVPSETDLGASGGFTARSWSCRSRGAEIPVALLDPYNVAAGIELTVGANGAVSCTLTVGR